VTPKVRRAGLGATRHYSATLLPITHHLALYRLSVWIWGN